jgi:hypothetical protein
VLLSDAPPLQAQDQMAKEMPVQAKIGQKPVQTPPDQVHLVAAILTIGLLPKDLPRDKPSSAANLAVRTYRSIARALSGPPVPREAGEDPRPES